MFLNDVNYKREVAKCSQEITDVVSSTYGYSGGNIAIMANLDKSITNDGRTVVNAFVDSENNPVAIFGYKIIQLICNMTDDKLKNATTTSALLGNAFIQEYFRIYSADETYEIKSCINGKKVAYYMKENLRNIKRNIDKYCVDKSGISLEQVAFNSCRDREMAKFIADIYKSNKQIDFDIMIDYSDMIRVMKIL